MTADAATADARLVRAEKGFLGHPVGLGYLAFTEAWERFSYYGMLALLVLYMVDQLFKPGHLEHVAGFGFLRSFLELSGPLSVQALASAVVGLYTAAVYFTPIAGGILGDLVLGRTRAITIGAVLMAIGHFLMAFEVAFIGALALLILGCGLVKGNIASQVGRLYVETDVRRSDGFQIFVLSIQVGVIAAPLICGTLGELVGWHWGFAAAGVGMLLGLLIYISGRKHLPPEQPRKATEGRAPKVRLTGHDWLAIFALLALLPILAIVFVGNNQIYNAYMIWARDNADLQLFGWRMPVTWLQSYDAAISAITLVGVVWFWRVMAKRGFTPHELTKLAIGCAISIAGFVVLAAGAFTQATTGGKVALPWLLAFHTVNSIGFANILPVALALYSRAAPASVNATMIGVFYLLFSAANLMVGWVGGKYEAMPHVNFWLLHAGFCAFSTAVIVLLYRPLRSALDPKPA